MQKTILSQIIDNYRSQLNPLRGLTMRYVVSVLEEGQRGAYADLQWLYKFVEKRDPTLRGVKRRLSSSLTKLDWNIKMIDELPEGQQAQAEAQQEALRLEYEKIRNLRQALKHLALAEFRGFAHLEKHWEPDGNGGLEIRRLEPVPQWHWCRDGVYGDWTFNAESTGGRTQGEPVELENFLIREIEDPIDEIALIAFVRKNMSQKDWDGFIENFGIPFLFLILPQLSGADETKDFQAVAEQVASNARGALPHGTDIKTADPGIKGNNPFKEHLAYQDEQIVLAGTSGLLTMLSMPQGIGGGSSGEHADTFDEIALAQAMDISEIFQEHFDRPFLDRRFPGQPHYAYFELAAKDSEDVSAMFDNAVKATQAGLSVDAEEMSEKSGMKLTRGEGQGARGEGQDIESQIANRRIHNRAAELPEAPLRELAEAQLADHADLLALVDALEAADTVEAYAEAQAALDAALDAREFDPAASQFAERLEALFGTAVVEGASDVSQDAPESPTRADNPRDNT